MLILAVDPGLTTGVAVYDAEHSQLLATLETKDPLKVGSLILGYELFNTTVVVENYVGAGPRTAEATHTLQVLGFVRWYAAMLGLPVVVQAPQQRLPYVTRATELAPKTKHAAAALAHAIAFAAKQGVIGTSTKVPTRTYVQD
jgi:hypothetical protein